MDGSKLLKKAPTPQPLAGTPKYSGLTVASGVCGVCALLSYIASGCWLFIALMEVRHRSTSPTLSSGIIQESIALALGLLFSGGLLHGASASCVALRDIARNSWK